ncbi:unnamed protein product [Oikopleura dioica]|uniref:Uncharacterized protein n=1 Tax=Oikopleura dioica TaxID=34765 RepID=E4YPV8_OIKDI|nr:unnamed protein product [Oikopleura dioica]
MTIQKPYNSGNETFWIWNPPRQRIQRRYETTLPYMSYQQSCKFGELS